MARGKQGERLFSLVQSRILIVHELFVSGGEQRVEVLVGYRCGEGGAGQVVLRRGLRSGEAQTAPQDVHVGVEVLIFVCRLRVEVQVESAQVAELHLLALRYEFEQTVHERHHHALNHASRETDVV